jgi:hypothetical protein
MKLIFCPDCHYVFNLITQRWLLCGCGHSGGQYNRDKVTATIGGKATVFGIGNPFFAHDWQALSEAQREVRRVASGYSGRDCWWGDFPGDVQIFRVEDPHGPRARIKMYYDRDTLGYRISIVDKRPMLVGGNPELRVVEMGPYGPPTVYVSFLTRLLQRFLFYFKSGVWLKK